MAVTHCICTGISFAQVITWARSNNVSTLEGVIEGLGCGRECGICGEYIRYAITTGTAVVPFPCPKLPEKPSR